MKIAQFTLIVADNKTHVHWEIKKAFEIQGPKKIILLIEFIAATNEEDYLNAYYEFRDGFYENVNIELPLDIRGIFCFTFTENFKSRPHFSWTERVWTENNIFALNSALFDVSTIYQQQKYDWDRLSLKKKMKYIIKINGYNKQALDLIVYSSGCFICFFLLLNLVMPVDDTSYLIFPLVIIFIIIFMYTYGLKKAIENNYRE